MILSYIKIALRTFARNKLYVFINVTALSVAMACGILAYVNFDYSRSFDTFHKNLDHLYVLRSVPAKDRGQNHMGITPRPLGPALVKDVPEVQAMSRIVFAWSALKVGDKVFNEAVYYVDKDFLNMVTFPAIDGTTAAVRDPSSIVLTAKTAEKLFGTTAILGQTVTLHNGDGTDKQFRVGAVLKDIPSNSSIQFSALLPYKALDNAAKEDLDWNTWSHETILRLDSPDAVRKVEARLDGYVKHQLAVTPDLPLSSMYLEPMRDVSSDSRDLVNDIFKEGMHPAAVVAPTLTAILLLLTACINFMNTTLAFFSIRLREVGIRKVLGGLRRQLVVQFIGENLLLCAVAMTIAIALAMIAVPAYSSLWPDWQFTLSFSQNWGLFLFLALLLVGMSVASGAYPSLYISGYSPVSILAGRQRFRGNNWLMRSILVFQFSLSALTVLTGIAFTDNADFISKFDLGFDTQKSIVVPLQGTPTFERLRNEALQDPLIRSVAGARHVVGYNQSMMTARVGDTERRVAILAGDEQYLNTLGMKLIEGRPFDRNLQSDRDRGLIVSRKFAKEFGWEHPIGQQVFVDSIPYTVIGEMENVYNRSVWRPLQPTALKFAGDDQFRYLIASASGSNVIEASDHLRELWRKVAPNTPYAGFYGTDALAGAIAVSANIKLIFLYVSGIAIAIAAMGLFALSSLIIVRRTKEIGIRKVMGASVLGLIGLLNSQIAWVLFLSSALAGVGGYFLINPFLDSLYAYHIQLQPVHYLVAAGLVVFIGFLTVMSQTVKVATGNPAESLRYE